MLRKIVLGLSLVVVTLTAHANSEWELQIDKQGVEVYSRYVDGFALKRVRAVIQVNSQIERVESVLKDVKNYPQWLADCDAGKIVQSLSADENIAHLFFNAPWPVTDRDVIFHRKITQTSQGGIKLDFAALKNSTQEENCCVRITHAEGFFQVEPTQDNSQELTITYEFVSDPGGSLPDWLASYTITEAPFNTLLNLKASLLDSGKVQ